MIAGNPIANDRSGLRRNEPMSRHTSWRVGGPADLYFEPETLEDLQRFLEELEAGIAVYWVGLGSNLLVRDGGIRGAVIATTGLFNTIERAGEYRVNVGSGVPCTRLARRAVQWGLGPAEFFAGIPGTVGGALTMNAGAFGGETWERVRSVKVLTRAGEVLSRTPDDYVIDYRSVNGPDNEWFIEAEFAFEEGYRASMESLKQMVKERKASQPIGLPSCGSVFRNPPGDHAGRLIEAAGLKGFRRGGAEVSPKHANFIINTGAATAADIEATIEHVRVTVAREADVHLVAEVRIIGELPR